MSEAARLDNAGIFKDNSDAGYFNAQIGVPSGAAGAAPVVMNTGTFKKTTTGTSTVAVAFENQGAVEAEAGPLVFAGGGVRRELALGSWTTLNGGSIILSAGRYWIGEHVNLADVQVTEATVERTLDTTPPEASISTPATYIRESTTVEGAAKDPDGIAYWEAQITAAGQGKWQTVCRATTPTSGSSYACSLATAAYSDGRYELRAVATDNEENTYTTAAVSTTIDNTHPTGSLAAPAGYSRGTVGVHGSATDATSGVASWQLQIAPSGQSSWQNACAVVSQPNEGSEYSCQISTQAYADGFYQLRALITDNAGNTLTTATVSTTIDNTPPTGSLAALEEHSRAIVYVHGSASDARSGVASWQLQIAPAGQGSWENACEVLMAPNEGSGYRCELHTAEHPNGAYQLRAIIADNAGNTFTTATVTTTIANTPPKNTEPPTISGTAEAGNTLSAQPGEWTGSGLSFSYQWESCNPAGGECAAVEGAIGRTYTLSEGDLGTTLRVAVTATDVEGTSPTPAASAPTAKVEAAPPVEVQAPSISGAADAQQVLLGSVGAWTGDDLEVGYQWESCSSAGTECAPVEGATSQSYELGVGDIGTTLRLRVGVGNGLASLSAVSAPTPAVGESAALANTVAPEVSGVAIVDGTLKATTGRWSPTSDLSYAYQWESCDQFGEHCESIEGATGPSYVLGSANVGRAMRVLVTASGESGSRSQASAATEPVASAYPVSVSPPPIVGIALEGYSLAADLGEWIEIEGGTTNSYQWERCGQSGGCTPIEGADTASYTASEADEQSTLRAVITRENGGESIGVSAPSTVIEPQSLVDLSAPSIAGVLQLGQTLRAEPGIWSGAGALYYTYQWESCSATGSECAPIEGASEPEYVLGKGDLGTTVRVKVTVTNPSGSQTRYSAATAKIPGGEITVEEAVATAERVDPAMLAPSTQATIEEQTVTPALTDGEQAISTAATLTPASVSKETPGEVAVETVAGEISFTPLNTLPNAITTPTIINASAAIFADTWPATDTIVRPDALGATTLLQLRSPEAPKTFSWQVDLGADQELIKLTGGAVAVLERTATAPAQRKHARVDRRTQPRTARNHRGRSRTQRRRSALRRRNPPGTATRRAHAHGNTRRNALRPARPAGHPRPVRSGHDRAIGRRSRRRGIEPDGDRRAHRPRRPRPGRADIAHRQRRHHHGNRPADRKHDIPRDC